MEGRTAPDKLRREMGLEKMDPWRFKNLTFELGIMNNRMESTF